MKKISVILDQNVRLVLIVSGLLLILLANTFDCKLLKIDLAQVLAHVGALLFIVGLLHWLFEVKMRREWTHEIFEAVMGANRLTSSGIVDAHHNSKQIDYEKLIESAEHLTIGEHYSSRIFEDYAPQFRERLTEGKETTVILLDEQSAAAKYLTTSESGHGAASANLARIGEILAIDSAKKRAAKSNLQRKWHQSVLRYSFVMTEDRIWVRFYTNSNGYSLIPALCVQKGNPLFDFFQADVRRLLEQSHA